MELRRAILLFAIVIGLAAIVSSVSRPAQREPRRDAPPSASTPAPSTPTARPVSTAPGRTIRFSARGPIRSRSLRAGEAATVVVEVPESGQVELEDLGLVAAVQPRTPAQWPVLVTAPGHYEIRFDPVGDGSTRTLGVLRVVR